MKHFRSGSPRTPAGRDGDELRQWRWRENRASRFRYASGSGARTAALAATPLINMVGATGIEPVTPTMSRL